MVEAVQPRHVVRTCIGCRQRASQHLLFRTVLAAETQGTAGANVVVPDPRRTLSGRGAWLHRSVECVELAQRRNAFVRALKVSGRTEVDAVVQYVKTNVEAGIDTDGLQVRTQK
ncbi:YlxR family protein [Saxibacter everestensis]|uniref:YlxR family protein n=1 Tax=Saxibacter everestensis TaxID=2909229 RepID=UPI003D80A785